jgi:hypothetical protein
MRKRIAETQAQRLLDLPVLLSDRMGGRLKIGMDATGYGRRLHVTRTHSFDLRGRFAAFSASARVRYQPTCLPYF